VGERKEVGIAMDSSFVQSMTMKIGRKLQPNWQHRDLGIPAFENLGARAVMTE